MAATLVIRCRPSSRRPRRSSRWPAPASDRRLLSRCRTEANISRTSLQPNRCPHAGRRPPAASRLPSAGGRAPRLAAGACDSLRRAGPPRGAWPAAVAGGPRLRKSSMHHFRFFTQYRGTGCCDINYSVVGCYVRAEGAVDWRLADGDGAGTLSTSTPRRSHGGADTVPRAAGGQRASARNAARLRRGPGRTVLDLVGPRPAWPGPAVAMLVCVISHLLSCRGDATASSSNPGSTSGVPPGVSLRIDVLALTCQTPDQSKPGPNLPGAHVARPGHPSPVSRAGMCKKVAGCLRGCRGAWGGSRWPTSRSQSSEI
jgi:hypothetical protein